MQFKTCARLALAALLAFATPAFAQVLIQNLPAGGALAGTEPVPTVQTAVTVKTTPAALWTYSLSQLTSANVISKWSGSCSVSNFLRGDGTCAAVSLTTNVSGLLPVANGGTGQGSLATDNLFTGNGTGAMSAAALPNCGSSTQALAYSTSTHTFSCQTVTGSGGTPAGSTGQIQYNNAGAFGASAFFTVDTTTGKFLSATGGSGFPGFKCADGTPSVPSCEFLGGDATGTNAGGTARMRGGTGGTSNAAGGGATVIGGTGGTTNGAGGPASVTGGVGTGTGIGGTATIAGGTGGTGVAGGATAVNGGQGGTTSGPGAAVTITGGQGGTPNGNSGGVSIVSGSPSGTGTVGDIVFAIPSTATQTGRVSFQDTSGDPFVLMTRTPATASYTGVTIAGATQKGVSAGVNVTVAGGQSSTAPGVLNLNGGVCSGATCAGVAVNVQGGAGVGTNQVGGPVNITGGTSTGTATGGSVNITGGATGTVLAGNVVITGGATTGSGVTGGTATIVGGAGGTSATGGSAIVQGGNGNATGSGGDARLIGGTGGASAGATGGFVRITGGTATNGPGGDIIVTASNGVGTNQPGGNLTLTTGTPTGSGATGSVTVSCGGTPCGTISTALPLSTVGSFTITLTGCTANPTGTADYSITGRAVTLRVPTLTCTSNAAITGWSGIPAVITPVTSSRVFMPCVDNGGAAAVCNALVQSGGTFNLGTGLTAGANFTASGTKTVPATGFTISYLTN